MMPAAKQAACWTRGPRTVDSSCAMKPAPKPHLRHVPGGLERGGARSCVMVLGQRRGGHSDADARGLGWQGGWTGEELEQLRSIDGMLSI
eukprot:1633461-Rhodomonas_salina.4